MDEERDMTQSQQPNNPAVDAAANAAAKAGSEAAKNFAKKSVSSAASNAVRAFLLPILPWILLVVIVLIVVIGIIMFFISGIGLIFDSIDKFSDGFKEYVTDSWYGEAKNVKPYQVIQVADKLESMGYDLFGEGFVTDKVKDNNDALIGDGVAEYRESIGKPVNTEHPSDSITVDEKGDGIARDEYGITNLNSAVLRRYLVSDNYIYTLYNTKGSWKDFFSGVEAKDGFILPRYGLIRLVLESSEGFGSFGRAFDQAAYNSITNKIARMGYSSGTDTIEADIDPVKKTLNIGTKRGVLFWKKTDTLSYNLEGWTGRYGMPLEFCLAMHLASEQPDLVLDMLNTFETHVNVGLHGTKAHFIPGIEISGQMVTLKDLEGISTQAEFLKKYYPQHYQEWLNEQSQKDDTTDTTDTTDTSDTTDTTPPEKTEEEKLQELIDSSTNTVTTDDGTTLHEVPAGSQGANGATTLFIDDEGNIYYPDGNGGYQKSGGKYDLSDEGTGGAITEEDDVVLELDEVRKILEKSSGGNVTGDEFDTFIPYIRNVSNHWFRDTYFVLGTDSHFYDSETGDQVVRLIKNDKEFEYRVGERWTMYETDEEGNYVLYVVNDDGSIGARYNGTQEQAIKEEIRVTKKAISQLVDEKRKDDEDFDSGVGKIRDSIWSAYELKDSEVHIDWTQWDEEARAFPGDTPDEMKPKLKYQITVDEQINQIIDGERAETNSKLKKMLTRYKYYSYDGTHDRAQAIAEDRNKSDNIHYQHEIGGVIIDGTAADTRNQGLVGKFLINAESEPAFKILENMNTLDADQIYRDLKELIVELNYFDKENLAGNDTSVYQWPLPDTGTIGWPVREFSKKEKEYGTLIHSKVDLKNLYEVYALTAETEGQGDEPTAPDEQTTAMITNDQTSILGQLFREQKESITATQGQASHKMEGSGGFGQSTFFDTAQACWDYIVQHGGSISYGALGACPFSAPGSIDCSGFVSWVIYEWGTGEVKAHFSSQRATPALVADNYTDLFGWTEIKLGGNESALSKDLQPGDIIVRDAGGGANGHTAIVKEINGGEVLGWDCGNASHWQTVCTETTIGSSFINGDGRDGKIIRIEDVPKSPEKYKGYEGNTDIVSPVTGEIVEAGKHTIQKNLETNETEEVGFIKLRAMTKEDFEALNPPKIENLKDISNLSDHEKDYAGFRYFYEDYKAAGVLGMYVYIEGIDVRIVDEALNLLDDSTIKEDGEYRSRYQVHKFDDVIGAETRKVLKNKEKLRDFALSAFPCEIGGQNKIFIKEGTVLGKTYTDGDLEENLSDAALVDADRAVVRPCVAAGFSADYPEMMFSNGRKPNWDEIEDDKKPTGNYITVILRTAEDGQAEEVEEVNNTKSNTNKDNIIEDIEDYFELGEQLLYTPQPYKAQPGDLELLASLIHHENCHGGEVSRLGLEDGERASKATGYVCVNRALVNYEGHGTTIREQIEAPGQYASKDAVINGGDYCDEDLEMAEWCLTYDCNSITNPSTNEEMHRSIVFQAGFCQCYYSPGYSLFDCWWVADDAQDGGTLTQSTTTSGNWDTFYCRSEKYEEYD